MKVSFSIHGTGCFLKIYGKEHYLYKQLEANWPQVTEGALFDLDEFERLRIFKPNGSIAKSIQEIKPDKALVVYSTDYLTRLEVKIDGKRKYKISLYDLVRNDLLFPLPVRAETKEFNWQGLLTVEQDIGSFGKCVLLLSQFDAKDLKFNVLHIDVMKKHYVAEILYNDELLVFQKLDTLNQSAQTFFSDSVNVAEEILKADFMDVKHFEK